MNVAERARRTERERDENRELVRGVDAVDVERGVRFREPVRLRLGERLAELGAALGHRREDRVAGAVDDAVERAIPIAGERCRLSMRMIGTPPPTLASKPKRTPRFSAAAKTSIVREARAAPCSR